MLELLVLHVYFTVQNLTEFEAYPGLEFLELLLATLHGQIFSLIQSVLQVLHSDLQVLLHSLQMSASVLLLLQLFSHHSSLQKIL